MSEWIKYTGSDEQIAEMWEHDYLLLDKSQNDKICRRGSYYFAYKEEFLRSCRINYKNIHEYLVCNPHPLADMIIRQAQTGQPVWWRFSDTSFEPGVRCTTTPDWNIPNAEYSFEPFEEKIK